MPSHSFRLKQGAYGLLLSLLLVMGLMVVVNAQGPGASTAPSAQTAAAAAVDPLAAAPAIRPGIYVFYDWRNADPKTYPITGGHNAWEWRDIEKSPGQYNWSTSG